MNDTVTHAESAADTQQTPKAPELKSTDTGVLSQIKAQAQLPNAQPDTATPEPKQADKPAGEKPDSHAAPAENGQTDADSSEAEHPADDREDRKIEPWMRKRLARAEEKGRRQALAELVPHAVAEVLRQVQGRPATQATEQQTPLTDMQPDATPKTLADFDNDIEAYTDYLVDQRVKNALAERAAAEERQRAQQAAEEAQRAFEQRRSEFESKTGASWDQVITAPVDVPQQVVDLLRGHPRDLYIAHYLVNHPAELDHLRGKSALEIASRLAAIDAQLQGGSTPGKAPHAQRELPPRTTKAPPPPPDLPSGTTTKSIAHMSTAERIAEWRRQKSAARR